MMPVKGPFFSQNEEAGGRGLLAVECPASGATEDPGDSLCLSVLPF